MANVLPKPDKTLELLAAHEEAARIAAADTKKALGPTDEESRNMSGLYCRCKLVTSIFM